MDSENRVTLYIDGYNFYYGIKNPSEKKPYIHVGHSWCNFKKLGENHLLQPLGGNSRLNKIKYFTSRVKDCELSNNEASRQKWWLTFLTATIPEIKIIEGLYDKQYFEEKETFIDKKKIITKRKEKLTDVNIAVNMLLDCFNKEYDTAILISADFDLFPAIKVIREVFNRDVWIWVPPESSFRRWKEMAKDYGFKCEELTLPMLANSLLPYSIDINGEKKHLPKEFKWHLPKEYR